MARTSLKRKLAFDTRTRKPAKKTPRKKRTRTTKKKRQQQQDVKPVSTAAKSEPTAPLKAKIEYSPNAMAKCQCCRKKIQKEHKRFGIPEYSTRYNKEIYRYYHVRCCPANLQAKVPNAKQELARQKQLVQDKDRMVAERQTLYQELKRLRLLFANRLEVSFFLVFNNEVLKALVVQMPTTHAELLQVHGIGPIKVKSFGDPILTVIRQYKTKVEAQAQRKPRPATVKAERAQSQSTRRRKAPPAAAEVIAIDIDDDDGDEIAMGAILSCEQLVAQKFAHAAEKGYLIAVD